MAALRKNIRPTVIDTNPVPDAPADTNTQKLKLVAADSLTDIIASPARGLQADLATRLSTEQLHDTDDTQKYPFKWTLIGVAAVSLAVWAGIASLIF